MKRFWMCCCVVLYMMCLEGYISAQGPQQSRVQVGETTYQSYESQRRQYDAEAQYWREQERMWNAKKAALDAQRRAQEAQYRANGYYYNSGYSYYGGNYYRPYYSSSPPVHVNAYASRSGGGATISGRNGHVSFSSSGGVHGGFHVPGFSFHW